VIIALASHHSPTPMILSFQVATCRKQRGWVRQQPYQT